jgi:glycosyltransferase involved in cell wall biosynthesis
MLQSLEAIDYSDQKVLNQFVSVSGFLGLTDMRAGPIIKFGACAIARREYALGLEAIQNGVGYDLQHGGTYTSDRENCLFVATQYDGAAQAIGWRNEQMGAWNNKQLRAAYVVSGICDDEASARTIASLARHCDAKRFKLHVYATESGVRRERQQFAQFNHAQPSSRRGTQTLELLGRLKVPCWTAPLDGDLLAAARELAIQCARDRIDVLIFDTTQADPVAAIVADWNVARARINLCRRTPMYSSGIHCVCYTDQAHFEADRTFWQRRSVDSRCILEGIDADEVLSPPPQRSVYGIPDNAVVVATCGNDLDRTLNEEFVETMINVLRAHPHAVYLIIGEGEMAWQKRKFESAGVSKRVGYAGRRRDLPGFLRMADLYVAEFNGASATGVLQAMSMERPVVAMRSGDSTEQSQCAQFVGAVAAIASRDVGAFIERICKLIREPQYRAKLGKAMRARVQEHFSFNQTARQIEQLCEETIQQNVQTTLSDEEPPMAQVA